MYVHAAAASPLARMARLPNYASRDLPSPCCTCADSFICTWDLWIRARDFELGFSAERTWDFGLEREKGEVRVCQKAHLFDSRFSAAV